MQMKQAGRISQIDDTIPAADKSTQEKLYLPSMSIKERQSEIVPSGKYKEVELGKQSSNSSATKLAAAALRTVESTKKKQQVEIGYLPGEWVIDINQRLKENNTYDGGKSWSIYRVPERLRQIQETAFTPKLVSIAPFHHNDINLQAGNEHKMRFLVRLLGGKFEKYDSSDTDETKTEEDKCGEPMRHQGMIKLEELEKAMKLLENNARACYSEAFNDITSDEFVQMMVLDGCFIIEVLRLHYRFDKSKHRRRRSINDTNSKHRHVNVNDPIFHSHWMIQTLQSDFLMFENQLPLFILQNLFSLTIEQGCEETKLETLGRFFFSSLIDPTKKPLPASAAAAANYRRDIDYDHLLHLFRDDFTSRLQEESGIHSTPELPTNSNTTNANVAAADPLIEPKEYQKLSYHARELQEAGVGIVKQRVDREGLLSIKIDEGKQLIKMHPLYLDDTTAVMLLNFLAFEQCHYLTRPYFTNYIVFLDCLIDNECDVEVLHKAGVLNHAFGNNNDVANLINRVGREIICDPNYNYLHCNMEDLNNFCKLYYASRVRTWWRNLIRNYFSTPWTVISLVAAVFLLILTLIQTFYAMYAYYLQPRSN